MKKGWTRGFVRGGGDLFEGRAGSAAWGRRGQTEHRAVHYLGAVNYLSKKVAITVWTRQKENRATWSACLELVIEVAIINTRQ